MISIVALFVSGFCAAEPIDIGSRRELFVDRYLIERIEGAALRLGTLRDEGVVISFDKAWEGPFCGYATILKDGDRFRAYYRGLAASGQDGSEAEVTCVAESEDGIHWTKPVLGLFEVVGSKENNCVLAGMAPFSHNFSPMIDPRPGCPKDERFKAFAGTINSGLVAFASADGLHWRKLREEPVLSKANVGDAYMFDSQNVAFWSEAEGKFLCYFRVFQDRIRRIFRAESNDFLTWTNIVLMEYRSSHGDPPVEQHYTNQTHAYFRAPHIYVGLAARFMEGRQVLTDDEAKVIGVDPKYFRDTSDAVLLTTRGGNYYDREFVEGFLRPGIGPRNWVSRTNYPALNVVQTGPAEMSLYVNQDYAQPTAHLHRYSLRLDGFSSAWAPLAGGEIVTKAFTFRGKDLFVNFATSAAGSLKVEIQDEAGKAIPGFALEESREHIGNEIEKRTSWTGGSDVSSLEGRPVRLRFRLSDGDLYSFRFGE